MKEQNIRTITLIGEDNFNKIANKKVMIIGIGGVGGYVCEALARAGVQNFVLIDKDVVSESNINRQIIALHSTIGKSKVEAMKERLLDINPNTKIEILNEFLTPETLKNVNFDCDYVVDAIDNVTTKIALAQRSDELGFKLISCMGTGNKICPELFEIADINKTSVCPLAKVIRKKLKEIGVKKLTVLYSKEEPIKNGTDRVPASISFTPSIAGLRIAEFIVKEFMNK